MAGRCRKSQPGFRDVLPATRRYALVHDLSEAMIRAATAHGKPEARIGKADPNWPDWYAEYMVREQGRGRTASINRNERSSKLKACHCGQRAGPV
jgi:hypothetical protein